MEIILNEPPVWVVFCALFMFVFSRLNGNRLWKYVHIVVALAMMASMVYDLEKHVWWNSSSVISFLLVTAVLWIFYFLILLFIGESNPSHLRSSPLNLSYKALYILIIFMMSFAGFVFSQTYMVKLSYAGQSVASNIVYIHKLENQAQLIVPYKSGMLHVALPEKQKDRFFEVLSLLSDGRYSSKNKEFLICLASEKLEKAAIEKYMDAYAQFFALVNKAFSENKRDIMFHTGREILLDWHLELPLPNGGIYFGRLK